MLPSTVNLSFGSRDQIFVLSKTFTCVEMGHLLQRVEGFDYCWSPTQPGVTGAGTHSLTGSLSLTRTRTHTQNYSRRLTLEIFFVFKIYVHIRYRRLMVGVIVLIEL
jgi:hypothetical protein